MMTWEVEQMYDAYCEECEKKNIEPMDIHTWWDTLE